MDPGSQAGSARRCAEGEAYRPAIGRSDDGPVVGREGRAQDASPPALIRAYDETVRSSPDASPEQGARTAGEGGP